MSLTDFTQNAVFQNMSKEKQNFLLQFIQTAKPQNKNAFLPFLMKYKTMAKNKNIQFNKKETDLMIDILCQSLPEKERLQVQKVLQLLH